MVLDCIKSPYYNCRRLATRYIFHTMSFRSVAGVNHLITFEANIQLSLLFIITCNLVTHFTDYLFGSFVKVKMGLDHRPSAYESDVLSTELLQTVL